jgi:chromate transporter
MSDPDTPARPPSAHQAPSLAGLAPPPTPRALLMGFTRVGISGFGGVLPYARRMLVETERWLTDREFTELLSAGQLLPGPNIVNVAIMVGTRFAGWRGVLAAVTGLFGLPLILFLILAASYRQFADILWVERMFRGVAAASAGLILAMGWKLMRAMPRALWAYAIALAAWASVAWFRLPIPWTVLALAPLGFAAVMWLQKDSHSSSAPKDRP